MVFRDSPLGYLVRVQLALDLSGFADFHLSGIEPEARSPRTTPWVSTRHGHVLERAHATMPVGTEAGGKSRCQIENCRKKLFNEDFEHFTEDLQYFIY